MMSGELSSKLLNRPLLTKFLFMCLMDSRPEVCTGEISINAGRTGKVFVFIKFRDKIHVGHFTYTAKLLGLLLGMAPILTPGCIHTSRKC